MEMIYKLIALSFGFREATDEDTSPPTLVVWHDRRGIHYSGPDAWRNAALGEIAPWRT